MSIVLNGTTGITTPDLDTDGLTSNGIDDNATSTAMTLDTSGNLLLGTTGTNWTTTAGLYAFNQSALNVTRSGAESMNLNRLSSDGDIAKFFKDGTTVGAIKVQSNRLALYCSTANSGGIRFSTAGSSQPVVVPTNNTGADSDATQDLGLGGVRWKDIYLSGGVHLGGTGAANKLEDYEEGTFTPSLGGNAQYNIQAGRYKKVGSIVLIYLEIRPNVLGTGSTIQISGLPFSATGNSGINPAYYDGAATAIFTLDGLVQGTAISLYGRTQASTAASQTPAFFQNNTRIYMTATYETTA